MKSRTLAASLVSGGKVRLNRQRVEKPSHGVRVGDVVTATVHRQVYVVRVLALGQRRGPAVEAQLLYEDLTEPVAKASPDQPVSVTSGRPDKRERREIAALKRREG